MCFVKDMHVVTFLLEMSSLSMCLLCMWSWESVQVNLLDCCSNSLSLPAHFQALSHLLSHVRYFTYIILGLLQ